MKTLPCIHRDNFPPAAIIFFYRLGKSYGGSSSPRTDFEYCILEVVLRSLGVGGLQPLTFQFHQLLHITMARNPTLFRNHNRTKISLTEKHSKFKFEPLYHKLSVEKKPPFIKAV